MLFLPGELPAPAADEREVDLPVGGLDIVTRLGLALRTKALNDELRLADVSLRSAALTDSLTGLANRRADPPPHRRHRRRPRPRRPSPHRLLRRRRAPPPDAWRDLLGRSGAALAREKRAGRNPCEVA